MLQPNPTVVRLEWHGPYTMADIVRNKEKYPELNERGVYLWLDKKRHCVSYVGKAASHSIWMRQYAWYVSGISGQSLVPEGTDYKTYYWKPGQADSMVTITTRDLYLDLVKRAFDYMQHYLVFASPLPTLDGKTIDAIERLLLHELKPFDTRFSKIRPQISVEVEHCRRPWEGYAVCA